MRASIGFMLYRAEGYAKDELRREKRRQKRLQKKADFDALKKEKNREA